MPSKLMQSYSRCVSFCSADSYDLLGLASYFKKRGYFIRLSRDVLHVSNPKKTGDLFFFNHGCLVSWGFKKSYEDKLQDVVKEFSLHPMMHVEADYFYYVLSEEDAPSIDIHDQYRLDIITLNTDDPSVKLAMSYGLAQSIKLEAFEEAIKEVIKKNSHLPQEIAQRGVVSLSRRAIFKRMGEIFLARSSINLNLEYLDVPEFFWRNPNLESFYIMTKKYLDIPTRVMALNQKLDVLQELLHILNSQVQHRHSSLLECIIICLIAAEIMISLFQLHLV